MATKEELMERAQLVRLYEASCDIEHPTEEDLRFRQSLHWKLGEALGLKEVRARNENRPSTRR
ncbi:MAG: hypothetical protein LBV12_08840 [Puniceicoccales bacterium]|jgi:hypothetical protein|nr:hypothetical protein [Puniceicoccales bacterium]